MAIGPTDGNLYALAQHQDEIERHQPPEEGDKCPCCGEGWVEAGEVENCSCHLTGGPCAAHMRAGLVCTECWERWE